MPAGKRLWRRRPMLVGRRGPVAHRRPAQPAPAAPTQLTGDEAIEPAVTDDDQRAVLVRPAATASPPRWRREPVSPEPARRNAATEHLRGARDKHPDAGRQPDRDAERLRKQTSRSAGSTRTLSVTASRAADSSARRASLATHAASRGRGLAQMCRRFDTVDDAEVVISTIPAADVASGDRPRENRLAIGAAVAGEDDLVDRPTCRRQSPRGPRRPSRRL